MSPGHDLLDDDGHHDSEEGEAEHDHEGPLLVSPGLVGALEGKSQSRWKNVSLGKRSFFDVPMV